MFSVIPLHFPFIQQILWKQYHPSFCSFCSNCQTQTATNHHHYTRENESTQDQQQGEKYSEPSTIPQMEFFIKIVYSFQKLMIPKKLFLRCLTGF